MAKTLIAYRNIKKGKLNLVERDQFANSLHSWRDCEVELTVKRLEPIRSDSANAYYWGVIIPIARAVINEALGETYGKLKIHEILKGENNVMEHETTSGRIVMIVADTHDMPHSEFCEYVERVRRWLLDFFGADTPDPVKITHTTSELKV